MSFEEYIKGVLTAAAQYGIYGIITFEVALNSELRVTDMGSQKITFNIEVIPKPGEEIGGIK